MIQLRVGHHSGSDADYVHLLRDFYLVLPPACSDVKEMTLLGLVPMDWGTAGLGFDDECCPGRWSVAFSAPGTWYPSATEACFL